jgi:hypothetical protein
LGTRTSNTRCGIPRWRRAASRACGTTEPRPGSRPRRGRRGRER